MLKRIFNRLFKRKTNLLDCTTSDEKLLTIQRKLKEIEDYKNIWWMNSRVWFTLSQDGTSTTIKDPALINIIQDYCFKKITALEKELNEYIKQM